MIPKSVHSLSFIVAFLLIATLATGTAVRQLEVQQPSVETKNGIIHGTIDSCTPDVRQFLGIPYAEPPLNELRFAPPTKKQPFDRPIQATQVPPSCMQYLTTNSTVYTREVLEFNLGGLNKTSDHISEDCLTLGVWAPIAVEETRLLPVLIFLHGGGFRTGGQDQPYDQPSQWVQRSKGHIVVILNHRLNFFGFPNAAGQEDGKRNVGLMDQRLAIEWVRDNIEDFGGDPARLVLWGQSAGAIATGYYAFAYYDDPIVKGFIMNSGTELVDRTTDDPTHSYFSWVASQVGCDNRSAAEELGCMQAVDAKRIENVIQVQQDSGQAPYISFQPIVDNTTVFSDWVGMANIGRLAKLPVIIGSNINDGVPFAPYNTKGVDKDLAWNQTMDYFFCPAWKSATVRIAHGIPVYRYLYSGNFTNISPKPWLGTWHSTDLPMIFGTHSNYRGNSTQLEYETSFMMQDSWFSFANGITRPNLGNADWPLFEDTESGIVAIFGKGMAVGVESVHGMEQKCRKDFFPQS
ncbi:acetylcholinesterase [Whalleya microplaca]|nr:acetylcholinesterase [Whalleya microplaca]